MSETKMNSIAAEGYDLRMSSSNLACRWFKRFIVSAGILLLLTATAKLASGFGNARVLQIYDPFFRIPFRYLLLGAGTVELIVAFVCLIYRPIGLRAILIAWLATNFLVYRFGLLWIGYQKPCGCLGNLTDALHISPKTADFGMKSVLAYLLIGSYATLVWLWKQKQHGSAVSGSKGRIIMSYLEDINKITSFQGVIIFNNCQTLLLFEPLN